MNERLEQMIIVTEDAAALRLARLEGDPMREPDETTEDDVILSMFGIHHMPASEVLTYKDHWTSALRKMIRGVIDQQG